MKKTTENVEKLTFERAIVEQNEDERLIKWWARKFVMSCKGDHGRLDEMATLNWDEPNQNKPNQSELKCTKPRASKRKAEERSIKFNKWIDTPRM